MGGYGIQLSGLIFIHMDKLSKHLCIRISETQFKKLADILVDEHIGKSELIRNIIHDYLKIHGNKIQWSNKTPK